jgi:hypothetical protein
MNSGSKSDSGGAPFGRRHTLVSLSEYLGPASGETAAEFRRLTEDGGDANDVDHRDTATLTAQQSAVEMLGGAEAAFGMIARFVLRPLGLSRQTVDGSDVEEPKEGTPMLFEDCTK